MYSMYTSVSPQKYVFNIMNLVGIASHITFTFLSDYSINFHVYMFLSVYIWYFYICFWFQNAWCIIWMQRYGMTDKALSYLTEICCTIFVKWIPCSWSIFVWNWHLCQMFQYFCIFQHIYYVWVYNMMFMIHLL